MKSKGPSDELKQVALTAAAISVAVFPPLVLAWGLVGAILAWAKNVHLGLTNLGGGSGEDKMAALEKRIALADLVAVAALADGRVDAAEDAFMASLGAEDEAFGRELQGAFDRWRRQPAVLANPTSRQFTLRTALTRLDAAERKHLRELAEAAPAGTRASASAGYRAPGGSETNTLRDELLAIL